MFYKERVKRIRWETCYIICDCNHHRRPRSWKYTTSGCFLLRDFQNQLETVSLLHPHAVRLFKINNRSCFSVVFLQVLELRKDPGAGGSGGDGDACARVRFLSWRSEADEGAKLQMQMKEQREGHKVLLDEKMARDMEMNTYRPGPQCIKHISIIK